MATYTTNLNLKKPAQSDKIRIADINGNSDDIDAAFGAIGTSSVATQIGNIESGMAIVSVGDTHAAISAGQYVYVKGHGTLNEGLYTANSALAANASLTSSNVTAVSGGGLNSLSDQIVTLKSYAGTDGLIINRVGRIAQIVQFPSATTTSGDALISTISDSKFRPTNAMSMASQVYNGSSYVDCQLEILTNGDINIYSISGGATAGYQAQYLKAKGIMFICNGD